MKTYLHAVTFSIPLRDIEAGDPLTEIVRAAKLSEPSIPRRAQAIQVQGAEDPDSQSYKGFVTFQWQWQPRRGPMVPAFNRQRKWARR